MIAVGLLAGLPLDAALASAVAAVPGPLGEGLASVASALRLGLPPERAWAALRPDGAHLLEIGRLLARVADGGVPAARLLTAKAAALRAASQADALAAARRVGVLSIFPLVLCLLPAFGLLCVIPTVLTALPGWSR
ncbi:MAG: type II secretion system F family protein [Frankiaceae bacterium]